MSTIGVSDAEQQLLGLFDSLAHVMFCAKDLDGRYQEVNAAFVRRSGRRSKRDVLGRRVTDLFPPSLAENYERQDRHVMQTNRILRDELEVIRRPDDSLGWYLTTKRPVHDAAGLVRGLVSISRDLGTPDVPGAPVGSLESTVARIRHGVGHRLSVPDLAVQAGCSTRQLDRRMRKVFGLTTSQYILRARIEAATDLLRSTDRPIADIAATCGFCDQAAFTKRFVRHVGETPTQFRRHH